MDRASVHPANAFGMDRIGRVVGVFMFLGIGTVLAWFEFGPGNPDCGTNSTPFLGLIPSNPADCKTLVAGIAVAAWFFILLWMESSLSFGAPRDSIRRMTDPGAAIRIAVPCIR